MMKPKQALVKDGFLPKDAENTRGRLSKAAIERCKELVALGWDIEGYANDSTPNSTPTAATVAKVKVDNGARVIADIGNPSRDENAVMAKAGTKTIGMRDVCTCGTSLTYCWCPNPTVWVDGGGPVAVNFIPRPQNSERPNKWW